LQVGNSVVNVTGLIQAVVNEDGNRGNVSDVISWWQVISQDCSTGYFGASRCGLMSASK